MRSHPIEGIQDHLFDEIRESSAIFSADNNYRYFLQRTWAPKGKTVAFICLNPSTADANIDDQTVRKCIRFAQRWGGARLIMGNLFAYRATDPRLLLKTPDPVGKENDGWLLKIVERSDILIAAWGLRGTLKGRDDVVLKKFKDQFSALHLTKNGCPSHPLYLPSQLDPFKI